jgi:hypothetical protein
MTCLVSDCEGQGHCVRTKKGSSRKGPPHWIYAAMLALAIVALVTMLSGCVSTYCSYSTPNGSKLSVHRRNLFVKTEMPTLKFNPDGSVEFIGYKADGGIDAVNAAIEAATKGAIKGVTGK